MRIAAGAPRPPITIIMRRIEGGFGSIMERNRNRCRPQERPQQKPTPPAGYGEMDCANYASRKVNSHSGTYSPMLAVTTLRSNARFSARHTIALFVLVRISGRPR
jgi:hypothetical protein